MKLYCLIPHPLLSVPAKLGVDVTLEVWPGMQHVWQYTASFVPEARQAIDKIGEFIKAVRPKERYRNPKATSIKTRIRTDTIYLQGAYILIGNAP